MVCIERLVDPSPDDLEAIKAPLFRFSVAKGFVWQPELLVLALHQTDGAILGGLIAELNWEWLHIRILAVDEGLRGQGLGRQLMAQAEAYACQHGCHHVWVDTFSFQARPFYEKLGYRIFGVLPDYPSGQERYFLAKPLDVAGNPEKRS